ncbi:MAG: hypothetical protein JWP08_3912 [Bryobacterales bacterium]|nr:hypothetical protein [Bryobacterales bacterium]
MLLAGTQILDWWWLLLLAAIGLAISSWRVRRRLVRPYDVARLIDDRLQLHDSLSTAWFLLAESHAEAGPIIRYQIRQAEQIASGIEPGSAFPLVLSRMWLATMALMLVIFGLFAARYLVNSSLSLKPALIRLHFAASNTTSAAATAAEKQNQARKTDGKGQPVRELLAGAPRDGQSQLPGQPPPAAPNSQTDSRSEQNANAASSGKSSQSPQPGDGQSASKKGSTSSQPDSSDTAGDSKPAQSSKDASNSPEHKGQGEPKTADGQPTPGLMDKMRDALSSLMAKMRPNSGADSSRDTKNNSGGQKGQGQQNASGKKQSAAPDQNAQKGQNSLDSQSSSQAAAVEKTPASSIGSSNQEMAQSKTNDPQSGAGRQDGQKDLKEADQLKAMGKLAEIIGKRSASLTGEIKVDKPTEEQQLQTQYTNQVGRHSNSGGEINRDEVPSEYQNYVRAYMKEVHKQANAK